MMENVASIMRRLHHSIAKEIDVGRASAAKAEIQRHHAELWGGLTEDSSCVNLDGSISVSDTGDHDGA